MSEEIPIDVNASTEDDPIVELPMKVICSNCKTLIREDIVTWPQSHVSRAKKNPNWKGTVISHTYCDNCLEILRNQSE